jgi:hypothetical protein
MEKKIVQFSICFHMLFEGRAMINYENMSVELWQKKPIMMS